MKAQTLNHCRLPKYIYVTSDDNLLLPCRQSNSSKILISYQQLSNIYSKLPNIYPTTHPLNTRKLQIRDFTIWKTGDNYGSQSVYISKDTITIMLYLCDIQEILMRRYSE